MNRNAGKLWIAGLLLAMQCAFAQAYPERALTLVVPFPASGTADIDGTPRITKMLKLVQTLSTPSLTDALAQELAYGLSTELAQYVRFERRAGDATTVGVMQVVRAAPDGHTLLFAGNQAIAIHPAQMRQAGYDPQRDLLPVAQIADLPIVLVSNAANPAQTVRQVIETARRAPALFNIATLGEGTTSHLASETFRLLAGVAATHVGYNGSASALNALATRNLEFGFVPLTAALPYISGGKIKIIAVGSERRHPAISTVPTIAESGVDGFRVSGWFGIFAPARTPASIVGLLNAEINRVLSDEIWQRMLIARGLFSTVATVEEFRRVVGRDGLRAATLLNATAVVH